MAAPFLHFTASRTSGFTALQDFTGFQASRRTLGLERRTNAYVSSFALGLWTLVSPSLDRLWMFRTLSLWFPFGILQIRALSRAQDAFFALFRHTDMSHKKVHYIRLSTRQRNEQQSQKRSARNSSAKRARPSASIVARRMPTAEAGPGMSAAA